MDNDSNPSGVPLDMPRLRLTRVLERRHHISARTLPMETNVTTNGYSEAPSSHSDYR